MDRGAICYRRFLDGDDDGIAEIVEYYKDGLILYLNGYVNNIYIAEELAEDTFFRLIIKKPVYSQRSSFKSWLYAIGRNIAVDYTRHRAKTASVPLEDVENYLWDMESLEQAYIREESKAALHKALLKLPTDYRAVLWLTFFEGFTGSELTMILNKNSRQMKNLLYRAKQSLKSILEKEGIFYEEQQ